MCDWRVLFHFHRQVKKIFFFAAHLNQSLDKDTEFTRDISQGGIGQTQVCLCYDILTSKYQQQVYKLYMCRQALTQCAIFSNFTVNVIQWLVHVTD